jgi:hypothetical protein
MKTNDIDGYAILASQHGAVEITFEPPISTGELLGQHGYPIVIRKNVHKSLREMIDEIYRVYEQLYNANKIDLIYWKDIQCRIAHLDYIKDDTHGESKFQTICNTLGARNIKLVHRPNFRPFNCRPTQLFDINLTGHARYDLIYNLIQEPYKAIMYLKSRSKQYAEYLYVEHFVELYERMLDWAEYEWKAAIENKNHPRSLNLKAISAETVLRGFSGFWEPQNRMMEFRRHEIIQQYIDCLEYDAPDYEIDEENIALIPIRYNVIALFDKDGPYDITSENYDE